MYPIKLKPIYDKTIWANNKLTKIRNIDCDEYGTCWEMSAHPYCQNIILNGVYKGQNLLSVIKENKEAMLGKYTLDDMLRVAYLDAKEDLSIQVHPYNEYALANDNDLGKTESWYVLDALEGATLVAGTLTTDKEEIRKSIADGTLEKHLRKVPIEKGDFIYIDAGMLHALGAGIFAIEIGTNSNVTYRFYDYHRTDAKGNGRELHLEKSFDVTDFTNQSNKVSNPFVQHETTTKTVQCESNDFNVDIYDVVDTLTLDTNNETFMSITFVEKDATILCNGETIDVNYTDTLFIPISCPPLTITGSGRVLVGYLSK